MRKFTLVLMLAAQTSFGGTQSLSQSAEAAWAARETAGQTQQAIDLWEKALAANPNDKSLYIRLTKATGRMYRHSSTKKDKLLWADRSRDFGAKAIEKNPQNAKAYAEYGVALGQYAEAHKGLSSLKLVKTALAMEQKAIALDPTLGFAHMVSSEIYRETPGKPLSIGDKNKALAEGLKAVEVAPNYPIHHVSLAKTYLALGQKAKAKEQLEAALQCAAPEDNAPEAANDKEDARHILKTL